MNKHLIIGVLSAAAILLLSQGALAASGPAPFECPWTAVPSGTTNPSSDGCYGGGADAGCAPSGPDGPAYPCTPAGDAQAQQALSLLQAGGDVGSVTNTLNGSPPGACQSYPSGPYIGCKEFYMAGPDDGSFTAQNYQSNASAWFIVVRCDPNCTDPAGCM